MNATHRHKTSGVEVSARRIEEPVTISLPGGEVEFEAGDYELTSAENRVEMWRADDLEENFEPIGPAPRNLQTITDAQREQGKQPADPESPEAAKRPDGTFEHLSEDADAVSQSEPPEAA